MAPGTVTSGGINNFEELEREVDDLLLDNGVNGHAAAFDELSMYRSGSAPPTVEGSRAAFGSLFGLDRIDDGLNLMLDDDSFLSDEALRFHPDYLSYYYNNERLNPRLPPPILSKEDWRAVQRFRTGTPLFDDRCRVGQPPGFEREIQPARRGSQDSLSSALLSESSCLGMRRKSFADAVQENTSQSMPQHNNRNASDSVRTSKLMEYHNIGPEHAMGPSSSLVRVKSIGSSISRGSVSGLDSSLPRIATPDPQIMRKSPSPCLPPVGTRLSNTERVAGPRSIDFDILHSKFPNGDVSSALLGMSNLSLSSSQDVGVEVSLQNPLQHDFSGRPGVLMGANGVSHRQLNNTYNGEYSSNIFGNTALPNNSVNVTNENEQKVMPDVRGFPVHPSNINASGEVSYCVTESSLGLNSQYQNENLNVDSTEYGLDDHLIEGEISSPSIEHGDSEFQMSSVEALYGSHLLTAPDSVLKSGINMDPITSRYYSGSTYLDSSSYRKAYIEELLARQKLQQGMSRHSSGNFNNHSYHIGNGFGIGMPYVSSPISSSIFSALSPPNLARHSDRSSHGLSVMNKRSLSLEPRNSVNHFSAESLYPSLLEEFKNNKTRSFELLDIVGHVGEFSKDQYGSRFIQQRLESATIEEKDQVFSEILHQARVLMTDVFGNYVIQKFFEHGTATHRNQLASQLKGHVLKLSLQMYGCRVIQKALEVVDVDQQTEMAKELDGYILHCVCDQNGNHVIQKCIEKIPPERIDFIISSFYGNVVALSKHSYGCRVIQRVLEYCIDPQTQSILMDEIMQSVCTLARDQYGNYVIQHVLQHGSEMERSAIIAQLSGQIVKMSQQKFASNVIEKCLSYGNLDERQLLIGEMLGAKDETDPLQIMMKDQYANYVVQKVLETCDDHNRELILSRIRVHLTSLKRYTYGKHIVARVEKLISAGERHSALSSSS